MSDYPILGISGSGDYDPRSNLNALTEDDRRSAITGTSTSRSFMCRLSKVQGYKPS
jgi:hypothetical protein